MKYVAFVILSILSIVVIRINVKLYDENYTEAEKKKDVLLQLNYLESAIKYENLGERMQQIFPEGYVFVNALYGLAWCEVALSDINDTKTKDKAIQESLYAYENIDSEFAKLIFPADLNPPLGIFYCGWKNYLLSKILSVSDTFPNSEKYISQFSMQSEQIVNALQASDCPFPESYGGQSWPADVFVAMASVSNYDKIFAPKHQQIITDWIHLVKDQLDPETGMVPHKVDAENGKTIQGARGCSMGLILRMLGEIDPGFANEQFDIMRNIFVGKTFGLPSIREYPKGQHGSGDIDSGPVIFGVGFSATIVMIGTFPLYQFYNLADQQYKTVHVFGFDRKTENRKMYLFGKLPMADAFIAWGRATTLNYSNDDDFSSKGLWGLKFHIWSTIVLFIVWALFYHKKLSRLMVSVKGQKSTSPV